MGLSGVVSLAGVCPSYRCAGDLCVLSVGFLGGRLVLHLAVFVRVRLFHVMCPLTGLWVRPLPPGDRGR